MPPSGERYSLFLSRFGSGAQKKVKFRTCVPLLEFLRKLDIETKMDINSCVKNQHDESVSHWDSKFFLKSPVFDILCHVAKQYQDLSHFPPVSSYQSDKLISGAGVPIRFVTQPGRRQLNKNTLDGLYQPVIFLKGQVPTREGDWHDFFNMLTWHLFPKGKAVLNRRQFFAFDEEAPFPWASPKKNRTGEQDALTLFDEGGAVIACRDERLWELFSQRRWKELFFHQRENVKNNMRFFIFGHAIFENCLHGHPTVHASAVRVPARDEMFENNWKDALTYVDEELQDIMQRNIKTPREFLPLPIYGIPGWREENKEETYFENETYFRPAPTCELP